METDVKINTAMPVTGHIEKFVPVFFGEKSALYGCHHIPDESHVASAVLICQPTGHEYERCHRAMRQLAVQSVRKGMAAMRFDYYGTGDSAGNGDEISLDRMREDIEQAIEACKVQTGAEHLTLVGLRLGATLAAQVACLRLDVESLVLYAPVLEGKALLADWRHEQHVFDSKHSHTSKQSRKGEILGFPVTETFQKELSSEFLLAIKNPSLKRVLILVDQAEAKSALLRSWVDTFNHHGVVVTVETPENLAIWKSEAIESVVPIKTIRRILKWIIEN